MGTQTQTNRVFAAHVFPRLARVTCICFEFWLAQACCVVYICCDWPEQLLCFWFYECVKKLIKIKWRDTAQILRFKLTNNFPYFFTSSCSGENQRRAFNRGSRTGVNYTGIWGDVNSKPHPCSLISLKITQHFLSSLRFFQSFLELKFVSFVLKRPIKTFYFSTYKTRFYSSFWFKA